MPALSNQMERLELDEIIFLNAPSLQTSTKYEREGTPWLSEIEKQDEGGSDSHSSHWTVISVLFLHIFIQCLQIPIYKLGIRVSTVSISLHFYSRNLILDPHVASTILPKGYSSE